jgi:hypothetical protein
VLRKSIMTNRGGTHSAPATATLCGQWTLLEHGLPLAKVMKAGNGPLVIPLEN